MFAIKTWCLPKLSEEVLNAIHLDLVKATTSFEPIRNIGITDQSSMLVLFPKDMMEYGLGQEIFIEAVDLHDSVGLGVRNELATKLVLVVKAYFSEARVNCKVRPCSSADGSAEA